MIAPDWLSSRGHGPGRYRITGALRPLDPQDKGISDTWLTEAPVYLKRPVSNPPPYDVANEYICGELGRLLRLPIPPAFIAELSGEPVFCSVGFNIHGENVPPIDAAAAVAAHPDLCTGCIVFDVWTINSDRHRKNIAYQAARPPHNLNIFDHSHSLFRGGPEWLHENTDQLGIEGLQYNRHCLLDSLDTATYIQKWIRRVETIPEDVVREVMTDAKGLGLPPHLAETGAQFLLARRKRLHELISAHRGQFTSVSDWGLEWE